MGEILYLVFLEQFTHFFSTVFLFANVFFYGLALLTSIYYCKSTTIELSVLILLTIFNKRISFISYYVIKFMISLIFFALGCYPKRKLTKQQILYHLHGIKNLNYFRAGLYYNGFYANYAVRAYNIPGGAKLISAVVEDKKAKEYLNKSIIVQPDGKSIQNYNNDQVKNALQWTGKCHDYVAKTLYEMSNDKFLTGFILIIYRWEYWIISVIYLLFLFLVMCFYYFNVLIFGEFLSKGFDYGVISMFIFDTLNLKKENIESNRNAKKIKLGNYFHILEYLKLLVICICMYSYHQLRFISPTFEYLIFISFSLLASLLLRFILNLMIPIKRD